ncbi:uncharacterized protein LOC126884050 isoform X2 [Diabrotica virgifera virgifera]|uniref:Uncharacterized protein n=2 Tax=Diabrotica virgifera virgifera TaxID=50390 RepID=A0ABM5K243_DIAVI|nr:uncharacterized protein LOC126878977 isoform X2 [Diabrotica virgifera virgifera]XP_050504260.1 uncharacterized protein LOC126883077 isoform X2 [Diabrotica virgifera virgifera]XP_050504538.1 uncharacterized protein LOC126883264 isoform X2 [Diabrotica virgifera virgifera]XP_050505538.1 uncharacterized protein LOC126883879 isoform X2 [Diabrotica virgifera virgifera]XP_050505797.1 uncharacterized protein LOC126884050 isoform X2 [Diabrotica virgifera virgifera]
MDINNTDMEQLATFMGHTKKTHEEWYRLPQDLYQTAKIAKLMIALNKGDVNIYKGKSLDDINIEENDYLEIENIETEVNEINEKEKVSSKGKRKLFTDEMTHPMQNNKVTKRKEVPTTEKTESTSNGNFFSDCKAPMDRKGQTNYA